MEIPIQRSPEHHRNLPSRARRRFEVIAGRIRNRGYEEVVVAQRWLLERVYMPFLLFWHARKLNSCQVFFTVVVGEIFGLDNDGPACRENIGVNVEFIGFEEVATKHRRDR